MSTRREFLTKTLSFASVAIIGGEVLSNIEFDNSKSIEIGKTKNIHSDKAIKVASQCGIGMGCSGGNGQCGMGMGCSGS